MESRPTDRNELSPCRFGMLTTLFLLSVLVLQVLFGAWIFLRNSSSLGQAVWIGIMWFGVSATTAIGLRSATGLGHSALGLLGVAWHVMYMSICWRADSLRYVLLFGSFAGFQWITAHIMATPRWTLPGQIRAQASDDSSRFSIRSLLFSTTLVAGLMAANRIYSVTENELQFRLLAVPLFVLVHLLAASAMLGRSHQRFRAVILVSVLFAGATLYSWASISGNVASIDGMESITFREFLSGLLQYDERGFVWRMQFVSFATFAFATSVWFVLGRIDDLDFRRSRMQAKPATD